MTRLCPAGMSSSSGPLSEGEPVTNEGWHGRAHWRCHHIGLTVVFGARHGHVVVVVVHRRVKLLQHSHQPAVVQNVVHELTANPTLQPLEDAGSVPAREAKRICSINVADAQADANRREIQEAVPGVAEHDLH